MTICAMTNVAYWRGIAQLNSRTVSPPLTASHPEKRTILLPRWNRVFSGPKKLKNTIAGDRSYAPSPAIYLVLYRR